MSRRRVAFSLCYALILVMLLCGLTIGASFVVWRGKEHIVYRHAKITNKTSPADVEAHFARGKEYSQFPAQPMGLKDGTCYAFTNEVSWLAVECFGTVQP